jgi:hypothetical protein
MDEKGAHEALYGGVVEAVLGEVRSKPEDVEDCCVCSDVKAALGEVRPTLEDVEGCCVSEGVKLLPDDPPGVVEGARAPTTAPVKPTKSVFA